MTEDICSNCGEPATKKDDIYCPTTWFSCDNHECVLYAAIGLWDDSSKEV